MIQLAPAALLLLAATVPMCAGTIWGNMLLLLIACGIFFGTISLGAATSTAKDLHALSDPKS